MISVDEFVEFNMCDVDDKCLDMFDNNVVRVTDEQARKIIEKYSKCKSVADFQLLDVPHRDKYLKIFKEKGLSVMQISRLTGVSFNVVRKFKTTQRTVPCVT